MKKSGKAGRSQAWAVCLVGLVVVLAGCEAEATDVAEVADVTAVKTLEDYKAEAAAAVEAVTVQDMLQRTGDDTVVFIDVREGDELERLGKIDGAVHIPRGVLEFSIDADSARHREEFSSGKKLVFYCATGGRSMLAAKLASDMGVADPVYLEGGFKAWSEANGPLSE